MIFFRSSLHLMAWSLLLLFQVSKLLFRVCDLLVPVSLGIPSLDRLQCLHLVSRFNYNVIKLD